MRRPTRCNLLSRLLSLLSSRKPPKRWWLLIALPVVTLLAIAAFAFLRAQRSLDRAGTSVAQQGRIAVDLRSVGKQENPGFEAIASPASYSAGAIYQGKLYVSGPSGLFVYGTDENRTGAGATLLKSWRVGLDLPTAPLGKMAAGRLRGSSEPELIIATQGEGILIFHGNNSANGDGAFRQIRPRNNPDAADITALLPLATGELLLGTRRLGLLVYGRQQDESHAYLEAFHPQLANLSITALAADAAGFWVGTRNQGLHHWHGGEIESFAAGSSASDGGLPDNQVDSIAVEGDRVYAGTPLGIEEFDDGRPARVLAANLFAHALYADGRSLTVGSLDEGIRRISLESAHRPGRPSRDFGPADESDSAPAEQFLRGGANSEIAGEGGTLFAILHNGLRREQADGVWSPLLSDTDSPSSKAASQANSQNELLTDGNISALAFDADGRLWVGYFDRGLDILSSDSDRVEHREDDHLFCINRIVLNTSYGTNSSTMAVATANGLVLFDAQGKPRQIMTSRDGLIADHVNDIAFSQNSMVLATSAGVTFVDATGARSLYAFEGLVNNHVYALGVQPAGSEILAGTLGGISILKQESVQRNLTASNSGLKQNWITAIVSLSGQNTRDTWMVGTYGAGIVQLGKDGRFTPLEGATRPMVVNPNAMLATHDHILAGTLGQGLWICARSTGHWKQIVSGLPSENVTAIAEHAGEIYVGTENGLVRIAERLLD